MTNHEPDVEGLIREGARQGGRDAKLRLTDRRLVLVYVWVVVMAVLVAGYGRSQNSRIAREQSRFERASEANCQEFTSIVTAYDGFVEGQIAIVQKRTDIPENVKEATITNYRSHLFPVADCNKLVRP